MFIEFDEKLDKLQQGSFQTEHRVAETTDTSWDECDAYAWTKEVLYKKTLKLECLNIQRPCGLFVTGLTGLVAKRSPFYRQICRRAVSVLTHGSFEILRRYQGAKHLATKERLCLDTPG